MANVARNEQLIRQHRVLQILESHRYGRTLRELRAALVEELGLDNLSERTLRRDLEALQQAGFDVAPHTTERGTVWKLGPALQRVHEIAASCSELVALAMGRELLTPLNGTVYWQGIETLWRKMEQVLPESVWKHFEKQTQNLLIRGTPAKNYVEKQGILATLNRAILQHRVTRIQYRSAGQTQSRERDIEPYALVVYRGSVYVVAALVDAPTEEALRHLKLDRFEKAATLDKYFIPRPNFDARAHFENSMGVYVAGEPVDIRVWFSSAVADWVAETPWHTRQSVESQPNGSIILTLHAAYEQEILPRVLALGPEAEVLAPPSCRDAIADAAQRLTALYTKPHSTNNSGNPESESNTSQP